MEQQQHLSAPQNDEAPAEKPDVTLRILRSPRTWATHGVRRRTRTPADDAADRQEQQELYALEQAYYEARARENAYRSRRASASPDHGGRAAGSDAKRSRNPQGEKTLNDIDLLGHENRERRKNELRGSALRRRRRRILFGVKIGLIAAALIVAAILLAPTVKKLLKIGTAVTSVTGPDTLEGLLPDGKAGYSKIDFQNAILGETRQAKELLVMEQEVEVESQISQTLANISLFSKTRVVHSYGTGVYTVNLQLVDADQIAVDSEARTVTVTVPNAVLRYVNIDISRTTFDDTQRGLLAFTEIKLTLEQKQLLEESIDAAMRGKLGEEAQLVLADEAAVKKAREVFQQLVTAVSPDYRVIVRVPERP